MPSLLIIAIDGPSGAGKSSSARRLAERLGIHYLDSGAIYRAITWKVLQHRIDPNQSVAVETFCRGLHVRWRDGNIEIDGETVVLHLRDADVTRASAIVSAYAGVRQQLLSIQRAAAREGDLVAEGRDIGTVVFPEATVKFYLDAVPEVRAQRRAEELHVADTNRLLLEMNERDSRDRQRPIAPLARADDAISIDSTKLTLDQVVEQMLDAVERSVKRIGQPPRSDTKPE
jgi:cytidylate kinase